jgi:transposase-like protein
MMPNVGEAWERLRSAAGELAPAEAVELYCPRCQAFQCHLTRAALLAGGVCLRRPVRLRCRSCGRDWKYNPGDSPPAEGRT